MYNITWSGGDKYHVTGPDGQFVVDKKECYCSRRRWQLSGIPCSQAISAMYYSKEKPENFIDAYYQVSTFMEPYMHILSPAHDRDSWPKSNQGPIIPPEPVNKRRVGRLYLEGRMWVKTLGLLMERSAKKD